MQAKIVRFSAVLGITALIGTQVFIGPAYASWGAAKLINAVPARVISVPVIPTTPVQPAPTKPTAPAPMPEPTPVTPPAQPPQVVIPEPAGMNAEEALMLQLINTERQKNGLKPLQPMDKLNQLARMKSEDIITKNYFSHTSPTYGSFVNMVYNAGIRYRSVGENLAKARNASHAFVLLMASSGHKANILSRNFTHLGLGVIKDKYGVVVTQLFIMQ